MQKSADFFSPALVVTRVSTVGQTGETPRRFYPATVHGTSRFMKMSQKFAWPTEKTLPPPSQKNSKFPNISQKAMFFLNINICHLSQTVSKKIPKVQGLCTGYGVQNFLKRLRNEENTTQTPKA